MFSTEGTSAGALDLGLPSPPVNKSFLVLKIEAGSYCAVLAGLELSVETTPASNTQKSVRLYLPSSWTKGVTSHIWQISVSETS